LFRFSSGLVGIAAAEQLLEATISRAAERLLRHERPRAVRTWLFRMARDARAALPGDGRPGPAATADYLPAPGSELPSETRSRIEGLRSRLTALPETERSALILHELGGLDYEEVAGTLGLEHGDARE